MSPADNKAVFLSYASQDAEAVKRLADALRAAGVEVWFDADGGLEHGDEWDAKIRRQIKECVLFIPVISANTQAREEGYFRLEWDMAAERARSIASGVAFILPVVIDQTPQADALVPDRFRGVQWTRLPGGEVAPEVLQRFLKLWSHRTGALKAAATPAIPPAAAAAPAAPVGRRPDPRGRMALAAAVLVLAAVGTYFALKPGTSPGAAPAAPVAGPVAPKPAPVEYKSIAVLPFVNLGADKADDYLGDGMTEELLNALAKVKGLRVPGRSSSFAFKGRTDEDLFKQVAARLRVSTVLEGSVRKVGDKLRITVQLIDCADGNQLWSEEYDRSMADLLAVQSEVAQQVVRKLRVALGVEESRAIAKKPTENPEAYRLYLLGRHHWGFNNEKGIQAGMKYFEEALRLDPNFALAYCGLADCYGWTGGAFIEGRSAWEQGVRMAKKALALDPDLADAHLSLGIALTSRYEWAAGEREMLRAIELNPNLPLAHDQLGWLRRTQGRFDEAIAESRKAMELDPLSLVINHTYTRTLYMSRRYDEAIAFARRTLELDPTFAAAHDNIGWSLLFKGDRAGALVEFQRCLALDDSPSTSATLAHAYAVNGDRAQAEKILRELEELARTRYVSPETRMVVYLGLGDKERALDWLERCYEVQDPGCWVLKISPLFDSLRREPRFQAVLRKVGLDQ